MSKHQPSLVGRLWSRWSGLPLWLKILIGMVLGMSTGLILGKDAIYLKPIGTLFVNTIKMLIVPLVFCSLIVGVTSMQDTAKMGRIGFKSFVFYLGTTSIAISLGLIVGSVIRPGSGLNMTPEVGTEKATQAPSVMETLINIVPTNRYRLWPKGRYCR